MESLINQNFPKSQYEIIVVDDESTDKTEEIATDCLTGQQDSSIPIQYIKIRHGGLAIARNTGISYSRGDILVYIDGDAIAHPDWLSGYNEPFKNGNADYSGGKIELLNNDSSIARLAQIIRHKQYFGPDIYLNHFIGCNMAIRKNVFLTVGGFIENFSSRGDEVSLQYKIKDKFIYQPAPEAVVYHERPDNLWDWIITEWKSATLWGLTRKLLTPERGWRPFARKLETVFLIILPFALIFSIANPVLTVIVLISLFALYRYLFVYPATRIILDDVTQSFGKPGGVLLYSLYLILKHTNVLFGNWLGAWKYRNTPLVPPGTTTSEVLSVKTSYQKIA